MPATYDDFFRTATSLRSTGEATAPQAGNAPYDYQRRLACGEHSRTAGEDADRPYESELIALPTRLGQSVSRN